MAALQPKEKLAYLWEELWEDDRPERWSVGFAGMGRCIPERAVDWLPKLAQKIDNVNNGPDLSILIWGLSKEEGMLDFIRERWQEYDASIQCKLHDAAATQDTNIP